MNRIKGTPISFDRKGNIVPTKVHYNGKSGSVRVCIREESGLKAGDRVYQEKLQNGIILLIPEAVYNE